MGNKKQKLIAIIWWSIKKALSGSLGQVNFLARQETIKVYYLAQRAQLKTKVTL